jgi:hypothetical protein
MISSKDEVITSPVVGNEFCLVVLWPETARPESRCPLYRVMLSSCTKSLQLQKLLLTSLQKCY